MSALLDELKSVLTTFREDVASQVNSGMLVTIDGHLTQLAAAAENGVQAAEGAVKSILGELYGALHGATPAAVPTEPTAPAPAPAAVPVPAEQAPAPVADPLAQTVIADPAPAVETAPVEAAQAPEAAV